MNLGRMCLKIMILDKTFTKSQIYAPLSLSVDENTSEKSTAPNTGPKTKAGVFLLHQWWFWAGFGLLQKTYY